MSKTIRRPRTGSAAVSPRCRTCNPSCGFCRDSKRGRAKRQRPDIPMMSNTERVLYGVVGAVISGLVWVITRTV